MQGATRQRGKKGKKDKTSFMGEAKLPKNANITHNQSLVTTQNSLYKGVLKYELNVKQILKQILLHYFATFALYSNSVHVAIPIRRND